MLIASLNVHAAGDQSVRTVTSPCRDSHKLVLEFRKAAWGTLTCTTPSTQVWLLEWLAETLEGLHAAGEMLHTSSPLRGMSALWDVFMLRVAVMVIVQEA